MNRLFSKDYAPEKTEVVTPEKGWKVDVDYDQDYDPFNDNERVGKIEAYSRDFCRQDGGLSRDEALELIDARQPPAQVFGLAAFCGMGYGLLVAEDLGLAAAGLAIPAHALGAAGPCQLGPRVYHHVSIR